MRHHFHATQWLPYPPEIVFAFFANPGNLPPLLPRWQRARIDEIELKPPLAPPSGTAHLRVAAGDGTRLKLSFRALPLSPVRLSWTVQIEEFRWNYGFADVQLRGPFRSWRQQHLVRAAASHDGVHGTLLEDRVEYELPLQTISALAAPLVDIQIASLFRFRHKRTAELMPSFAATLSAGAGSPA